jgi:hypothetical protein
MADEADTGDLIADTSPAEGEAPAPEADKGDPPSAPASGEVADLVDGDAENTTDPLSGDGKGGEEGVPEAYTFEPPEGVEMTDALKAGIEGFHDTAKEMGLSQAQFQKLVEYDLSRATQMQEAAVEGWQQRVTEWVNTVQADKEIGGDNLVQTKQTIEAAVKQFGDADLRALLRSPSPENPNGMSIGNHPAVVRFLNRVGKAVSDPSLITGEAEPPMRRPEERLYPSMFPTK